MVHLALVGGEGPTGNKGRGEITGVVSNAPTMASLRKNYGEFGRWGDAARKVELEKRFKTVLVLESG